MAGKPTKDELNRQVDELELELKGLRREVEERRRSEEPLLWEAAVNRALAELSGRLLSSDSSEENGARELLRHALSITGSEIGYVSTIDRETGDNVRHTFASPVERQCGVPGGEARVVLPRGEDGRYGALWGRSLDTGEAFFTNSPAEHASSRGTPPGHIPIESFLSAPFIAGGSLLGQIALANSPGGYTDKELEAVVSLADLYALFMHGKLREREIREAEQRFRKIFELAPDAYYLQDLEGRFLDGNPAAERLSGYGRQELIGRRFATLLPPGQASIAFEMLEENRQGRPAGPFELTLSLKDGAQRRVEIATVPVDIGGRALVLGIARDVTDRKRLEEQFLHSQKMESVGRLAGGVAHDFNNVLTAIMGNTGLLLGSLGKDDPLRRRVEEIEKACKRASSITRQLLAFSRKQVLQPQVLDLNEVIRDLEKMLGRLLGEHIELEEILSPKLGSVEADPGQIQQVIMNLAVNARDAMPRGGTITIETANVELDAQYARLHDVRLKPGPYVMMAFSDTGEGMEEEVQKSVFEPFFTTKANGKGTGLGLSTVYGIVKQSGGYVWVYSEPGRGTTFKVYLPRVDKEVGPPPAKEKGATSLRGDETILVAEDDELVRNLAQEVLEQHGYRVLAARDGREALKVFDRHGRTAHLLLTDVVMPGLNGPELAEKLGKESPGIRVLYMSGYTNNTILHQGVLEPGVNLIEKPFSPEELARKVRDVLDAP